MCYTGGMIRPCRADETDAIFDIINDAAEAYRGVIPTDCWHEPYMSREELVREVRDGVTFRGFERDGELAGVMGSQPVKDVTLIRHAYSLSTITNGRAFFSVSGPIPGTRRRSSTEV